MPHKLSPIEELARIRAIYRDDTAAIMAMLERQFAVLHNRAQVLLGLCGIVISTTGFSGRIIAGTNRLAQALIILGVTGVLAAAGIVSWGVLHLRWLSQQPGELPDGWLATSLAYRDRKTRYYRYAIVIMLVGLTLYVGAICVMLANPHVDGLPAR
ncbi:MAG: hypothetical protein GC164_04440 [Phycisphaera sp.]|nr:hypothetical protein [Phycisphaera sp.]